MKNFIHVMLANKLNAYLWVFMKYNIKIIIFPSIFMVLKCINTSVQNVIPSTKDVLVKEY